MAYVKRIGDGAIFEVFGAETQSGLKGRDIEVKPYFLIFDAEFGTWDWAVASAFMPLEELVPDDFEDDEEEDDDEHLPIPSPERRKEMHDKEDKV